MEQISQNLEGSLEAKNRLASHIEKREKVKEMYRNKGVQMLDKPELVFSNIQEPKLKPQQSLIYQAMKNELIQKDYSDFRFLGQGQQGLVLLAKDSKTNMRYAIKGVQVRDHQGNLDENLNNQVKQEVDILKKCRDSPYVVSFLNSFEGQQFSFLVLAECQGTLTEILESSENKRLNEISAIKYAKDIAEGLYYIHSKNCLVNDLKMDNILIDYNGNAVISDFGFADHLKNKSGYAINQYMGNILYQAPECSDPADPIIGKVYYEEYQKLGVKVTREPSNRSEAFSLGYLIYALVQGVNCNLTLNKHKPLNYDNEFKNFLYHQWIQQIIDGLTNYIPRNRLSIKEALIILKGIISFEFQLDDMLIEMIDENTQQFTSSLKKEIEFVQELSNKFYPIIKNQQNLIQELKEDHQKIKYEEKIAELLSINLRLKQTISEQEETIYILLEQLQKNQNQSINLPQKTKDINQKQTALEEIKKQEKKDEQPQNKSKLMKGFIQRTFCYQNGMESYAVLDSYERVIGLIKPEDWEGQMMVFYQLYNFKKQIGKISQLGMMVESNDYGIFDDQTGMIQKYECEYELN